MCSARRRAPHARARVLPGTATLRLRRGFGAHASPVDKHRAIRESNTGRPSSGPAPRRNAGPTRRSLKNEWEPGGDGGQRAGGKASERPPKRGRNTRLKPFLRDIRATYAVYAQLRDIKICPDTAKYTPCLPPSKTPQANSSPTAKMRPKSPHGSTTHSNRPPSQACPQTSPNKTSQPGNDPASARVARTA